MTSIDPAVEDRFAQILARTRANAADITDRVEATKRQIAEESERMRESNERLCKELDEQAAARAANDDPAAKNEWLKRNEVQEATYQFGGPDEPAYEAGPETTERTAPPPAPPAPEGRGRHSRRDEFDEDDFSNNSWLG
ncbi:MAG TPA: hypothetical protein VJ870_16550 [Amycolatopsis sp.]|nr:hypothetical protein [Amycolatopsis sp.]